MSKDTKKEKKEQKNNFMKELRAELKKVTWPSRNELVTNTMTVIVITLIIAAIVFVLDFSFEKLYTYGVGSLKNVVTASESSEETETTEEATSENETVDNTVVENTVDANTTVDATNTTDTSAESNQVTENTTVAQ